MAQTAAQKKAAAANKAKAKKSAAAIVAKAEAKAAEEATIAAAQAAADVQKETPAQIKKRVELEKEAGQLDIPVTPGLPLVILELLVNSAKSKDTQKQAKELELQLDARQKALESKELTVAEAAQAATVAAEAATKAAEDKESNAEQLMQVAEKAAAEARAALAALDAATERKKEMDIATSSGLNQAALLHARNRKPRTIDIKALQKNKGKRGVKVVEKKDPDTGRVYRVIEIDKKAYASG